MVAVSSWTLAPAAVSFTTSSSGGSGGGSSGGGGWRCIHHERLLACTVQRQYMYIYIYIYYIYESALPFACFNLFLVVIFHLLLSPHETTTFTPPTHTTLLARSTTKPMSLPSILEQSRIVDTAAGYALGGFPLCVRRGGGGFGGCVLFGLRHARTNSHGAVARPVSACIGACRLGVHLLSKRSGGANRSR